jgi:hypothetical protein
MERPAIITALLYIGVFLIPGFFCTGSPPRRPLLVSTTIIMASYMDQHHEWFLDTTPLICG